MTSLLVMSVGQTDVQLVIGEQRHKLDGDTCGILHDAIRERPWSVVDAPTLRSRSIIKELPADALTVCTPKVDAVLAHFGESMPRSALVFETNREDARDPRMSGVIMARRLRERGVSQVTRVAFLSANEQLEDPANDADAVVRRAVVSTLSKAIGEAVASLTAGDHVFVATTGGLAAANELITELVRLHAVGGPTVTALEVPDGNRAKQDERAVEEKLHPASGFRARWQALSLVEKGNLLGAWGAVSHLEGAPGQGWTQVIQWLALFASSLPLPQPCDLSVLSHQRMTVRAALRVELALRSGDIPRAVHGTVAFCEAALWDNLLEHFERDPDDTRRLKLKAGAVAPIGRLLREGGDDDKNRPFESKPAPDREAWFWFHESGAGRFARDYLKSVPLKTLLDAVEKVKALRNDVAHNEPTPALMNEARTRMQTAALWSSSDTFLSQLLIQSVLQELGEASPEDTLENLLAEVRHRLREPRTGNGQRVRGSSLEVPDGR